MNGRMYDTDLRRFLSPDNYVQDPTNTQNYNRYQYGYNNPLKYSDPNGEFLGIALGILGFGAVSYFTGVQLSGGQYNPLKWNIGTFAKVGALALLNVATAGIGSTIYAGVLSATGLAGFVGGFTAGAISGAIVGLMSGAGYALAAGQNIVKGALNGAIGGAISGGLFGGVSEGLRAMKYGGKFWNGKADYDVLYRKVQSALKLKPEEPILATDENLRKITESLYFRADLDKIDILSTEHIPQNASVDGIYTLGATGAQRVEIDGIIYYTGRSNVYIHKNTFNNFKNLYNTIGHELVHVSQNAAMAGQVYNASGYITIIREYYAYDFEINILHSGIRNPFISEFNSMKGLYPNLINTFNWQNFSWTKHVFLPKTAYSIYTGNLFR